MERSLSSAADNDHSSEDCWKKHLDTSSALQEGDTHPGQFGVSGRKTGYKGGGKASRALRLNPVKKPTEPQVLIRMAGNVLCIFLSLWTQSGMTGSALEQSKPYPVPAWVFNNYWLQFKNTTAHIKNKTNGYACDATGYTFFWTVAI